MTATRKRPDVRRALEAIIDADGMTYTFLDRMMRPSAGALNAGARAHGTIRIDDLDVEVSIVVRQGATTRHETRNYRDQALSLLVRHGWRDHCCASVRDRNPYRLHRKNSTTGCSKAVTTALVEVAPDKLSISFACNQHARTEYVGALILELSPADLKAVRTARSELAKLADDVYKRGERWGEDRPEFDAAIERVLGRKHLR